MEAIEINAVSAKLDKILLLLNDIIKINKIEKVSRSEDLKDLFTALAKAQGDMVLAPSNSINPYFKSKYSNIEDVIKSSRPSLTKHGLSVIQQIISSDDGQSILHTILAHASGQWIESTMRINPPKADIQSFGSFLNSISRHSYTRIVGMGVKEDDDDGEIAMVEAREVIAKGPSNKYNPKEQSFEVITKEQLEEIEYELAAVPDLAEEIMDKMRIQSMADLPKSKYQVTVNRIREIKLARGIR
jgi:hypothetical protein